MIHPGACPRAPLDPSKVKAGDTVEVRVDAEPPWTIAGTVTGGLGGGLWVGPAKVSTNGHWHDSATLTDHQPAPEPEPEWKPGTVHAARLAGGADPFHTWVIDLDEGARAFMDEGGNSYDPGELLDVHELVVIDPAAVDVDALLDGAIKSAQGKGYWPDQVVGGHMIRHALAALGIEAP